MKIEAAVNPVERGGIKSESQFTIQATAQAFQILSSGLYSDKILAIIRELSCNAYDSHVEAGKKDVPFEIKLPNVLDTTFYVKDFGLGLDYEGVTKLYTTYFRSTKGESNEVIGALGLGSKSPFSYVQSFNVESRFNGTRTIYTAFMNEEGLPSITMLGSVPTDEPNGLTVSFAAKSADSTRFNEAAKKALMYFPVQPKVVGSIDFKPYEVKHLLSGDNWKVRTTDYYAFMNGAYVVQGTVAYPLDRTILAQHEMSPAAKRVLQLDIDMYVPIGDVEVAASREQLSYTKRSIANIIAVLEKMAEEIVAETRAMFEKEPSLWHARQLFARIMKGGQTLNNFYSQLLRTDSLVFEWKGQPIKDAVVVESNGLTHLRIVKAEVASVAYTNRERLKETTVFTPLNTDKHSFTINPGMIVIVDDLGRCNGAIIQEMNRVHAPTAIVISPLTKEVKQHLTAEAKKVAQRLGGAEIVYTSTIDWSKEKAARAATYYKARKKDEALRWTGFVKKHGATNRTYSRLTWSAEAVDVDDGGFYVDIKRFSIFNGDQEQDYFDGLLESAINLGLIPDDVKIYGLTEKQVPMFKEDGNWINLLTHIKTEFNKRKTVFTDKVVAGQILSDRCVGGIKLILDRWVDFDDKIAAGKIRDAFLTLLGCKKAIDATDASVRHIRTVMENVNGLKDLAVKTNERQHSTSTTIRDAFVSCTLLRLIDWSRVRNEDLDDIIEYFNTVSQAKK